MMLDIFDLPKPDLTNLVCHSGGALGSDTFFRTFGNEYGVKTIDYSYKTKMHNSPSKFEISDDDYKEGVLEINKANLSLKRYGIHKYMSLLARNWAQVKYSNQTFAIGNILNPGDIFGKYRCNSTYQSVSGGTGYAVQMSINHNRPVYVFDQNKLSWFRWSYTSNSFVKCNDPIITQQNFAGIGTREIDINGIESIKKLYKDTFNENK